MKLETSSKSVDLVIKTRKIVDIANVLKNKKFEEAFFNAVKDCDLDALPKIIFILAEENGKSAFKNSNETADFIDEYKKENDKTYDDIYKELTDAINNEGFFRAKMTEEEIQAKINDIMSSVNYDSIIKNAIEKTATEVVSEEFKGFKA